MLGYSSHDGAIFVSPKVAPQPHDARALYVLYAVTIPNLEGTSLRALKIGLV